MTPTLASTNSNSFSYNTQTYMSTSTTTSPASTPLFTPYIDKMSFKTVNGVADSPPKINTYANSCSLTNNANINANSQNLSSTLSTSTSSTSLPSTNNLIQSNSASSSNNNNNGSNNSALAISSLAHNSRSFGDINDAAVGQTANSSLSPPSSIATTPTYSTLSSSFLRIYIGSSTAVIEKKPIPLRDALSNKLKRNNLDIDKCIAYLKDSKYVIFTILHWLHKKINLCKKIFLPFIKFFYCTG